MSGKRGTPLDRFNRSYKVNEDGCWIWQLSVNSNGYGIFVVDGKKVRAHIWSYLNFIGEYDRKLDVDHTCHNHSGCLGGKSCPHRRCVNPAHLEPITRMENANRGQCGQYLAGRTHCKNGHKFTPKNTQYGHNGRRRCKKCRSIEHQKFKEKHPEKYKERYTKANLKYRHGITTN